MITIVFGLPGAGKTALLAAEARVSLLSRDLYVSTCEQVKALNMEGFNYTLPEHSPTYTNFALSARKSFNSVIGSYYIDGFHMGFPNKYVPVFNVYPGSRIFLSEAQRYYNSRKSKDFPEWISRWFEEHRHFGLDIWLDVQRPGLIDVNIRDIAERFIQVLKVYLRRNEESVDEHLQTVFEVVVYNSYADVEADKGEAKTLEYDFNVFENYESKSYYRSFLPATAEYDALDEDELDDFIRELLPPGDFHRLHHVGIADVEKDLMLKQFMYRQIPPKGFYGKEKKKVA